MVRYEGMSVEKSEKTEKQTTMGEEKEWRGQNDLKNTKKHRKITI